MGGVIAASYDLSGKYLITAGGGTDKKINVWDLHRKKSIFTVGLGESYVRDIKFHPDGQKFYTADSAGVITKWNFGKHGLSIKPGKRFALSTMMLQSLAISFKGEKLVTAGLSGDIYILDLKSDKGIKVIKNAHTRYINRVTNDMTGDFFISSSADSSIKIWSWESGELIKALHPEVYKGNVNDHCLIGAQELVSAHSSGYVVFWNIRNGKILNSHKFHSDEGANSLDCDSKNDYLLSGGNDEKIIYWDNKNKKQVLVIQIDNSSDAIFVKFDVNNKKEYIRGTLGGYVVKESL